MAWALPLPHRRNPRVSHARAIFQARMTSVARRGASSTTFAGPMFESIALCIRHRSASGRRPIRIEPRFAGDAHAPSPARLRSQPGRIADRSIDPVVCTLTHRTDQVAQASAWMITRMSFQPIPSTFKTPWDQTCQSSIACWCPKLEIVAFYIRGTNQPDSVGGLKSSPWSDTHRR
jgi:hypothetical protein